jgi:hypothetical protein
MHSSRFSSSDVPVDTVQRADLPVNTGILALENAVDLICQTLEYKARRLSVVTGELGPATGLTPYAGRPGDFRPPESMTESSR